MHGQATVPIIEITRHNKWGLWGNSLFNPLGQVVELTQTAAMQKAKVDNKEIEGLCAHSDDHLQDGSLLECMVRDVLGLNGEHRKFRQEGVAVVAVEVVGGGPVDRLIIAGRENLVLWRAGPMRLSKGCPIIAALDLLEQDEISPKGLQCVLHLMNHQPSAETKKTGRVAFVDVVTRHRESRAHGQP
ncbi:MAG: hypothetical protein RL483_152 [Pseudomonadota bacterium]